MTLDDSGTRPILFVGSGFSIRYINGPNWLGLLKQLVELNPEIKMPIGIKVEKRRQLSFNCINYCRRVSKLRLDETRYWFIS